MGKTPQEREVTAALRGRPRCRHLPRKAFATAGELQGSFQHGKARGHGGRGNLNQPTTRLPLRLLCPTVTHLVALMFLVCKGTFFKKPYSSHSSPCYFLLREFPRFQFPCHLFSSPTQPSPSPSCCFCEPPLVTPEGFGVLQSTPAPPLLPPLSPHPFLHLFIDILVGLQPR